MKRLGLVTLLGVVLGLSTLAHSALVDNGNGLIYDTGLDLTWYDAPPVPRTWIEAKDWAASLTLAGTTKGSWRLPVAVGTESAGAKVYPGQGEMWHLYFDELHNVTGDQLTHTVPFKNLWPTDPKGYWTGTLIGAYGAAYCFWPKDGRMDAIDTGSPKLALAVHPGNAGAPLTASASKDKKISGMFMKRYEFVTAWGTSGTGSGQFAYPLGIGFDSSGNVYVADMENHRIQKFTSTGAFITKWGSNGTGDGQFAFPKGVAVDSSGNVYVTDTANHRIQKFTSTGAFMTKWGSNGTGNGQFYVPSGVAVDTAGNVYVADATHRIQKFTSTGAFITKWGSYGAGDGQLNMPDGVAVDSPGNIYVADLNNNRIQKFSSTGAFVTKWGSYGTGNGQFYHPCGVAIDSSGNVYVADLANHRVQKLSSAGAFMTKVGSYGTGNGQFNKPAVVAVDSAGNVYVADSANHRIQKFGLTTQGEGLVMKGPPVSKKTITSSAPAAGVVEKAQTSSKPKQMFGKTTPPGPAIPNVSGQWKSSIGLVYNITQQGSRFGWTVANRDEKGEGTVQGNTISASWKGKMGSGSSEGKITAVDSTGKATQIEWKNGVRFYR